MISFVDAHRKNLFLGIFVCFCGSVTLSCVARDADLKSTASLPKSYEPAHAEEIIQAYLTGNPEEWKRVVYDPFLKQSIDWLKNNPDSAVISADIVKASAKVVNALAKQMEALSQYSNDTEWSAFEAHAGAVLRPTRPDPDVLASLVGSSAKPGLATRCPHPQAKLCIEVAKYVRSAQAMLSGQQAPQQGYDPKTLETTLTVMKNYWLKDLKSLADSLGTGQLSQKSWQQLHLLDSEIFDQTAIDREIVQASLFNSDLSLRRMIFPQAMDVKNGLLRRAGEMLKQRNIGESQIYDYLRDISCLMSFGPHNYPGAYLNYIADSDAMLCLFRKTAQGQWRRVMTKMMGEPLLSAPPAAQDRAVGAADLARSDLETERGRLLALIKAKAISLVSGTLHIGGATLLAGIEHIILNTKGSVLKIVPVFGTDTDIQYFNKLSPYPLLVVSSGQRAAGFDEIESSSSTAFAAHDLLHVFFNVLGSHAEFVPIQSLMTHLSQSLRALAEISEDMQQAKQGNQLVKEILQTIARTFRESAPQNSQVVDVYSKLAARQQFYKSFWEEMDKSASRLTSDLGAANDLSMKETILDFAQACFFGAWHEETRLWLHVAGEGASRIQNGQYFAYYIKENLSAANCVGLDKNKNRNTTVTASDVIGIMCKVITEILASPSNRL